MKKLITIMAVLLTLGMTGLSLATTSESTNQKVQITLSVEGLTCATCVPRLRIGLNRTGAVHDVDASVDENRVIISYDPQKIDVDGLIEAIESVGFRAKPELQSNEMTQGIQ